MNADTRLKVSNQNQHFQHYYVTNRHQTVINLIKVQVLIQAILVACFN